MFFFFKQKTAYEMRISDWSSDVCSSDLAPAQALTREQVLRAYTAGSAYAEFAEDTKGRLAPGYVADLAVLSQDVLDETVPVDALPATTSLLTIIGGEVAWHDPAFRSEERSGGKEVVSRCRSRWAT